MKINVLAFDEFIWTNQIRVNGESARASFDWLQEGGPASSRACKSQLVRESCQNSKRRKKKDGAVQVGLFRGVFTLHTQQVI